MKVETESSRFRGVYKCGNRWKTQLKFKGVQFYLGTYDTEEEAAKVIKKYIYLLQFKPFLLIIVHYFITFRLMTRRLHRKMLIDMLDLYPISVQYIFYKYSYRYYNT